MTDPFIGEIQMTSINFAPRGWAVCDGQILSISQYTALFSLLGTQYGGNGRTTFALPDLRGRFPMNAGSASGLPPRGVGDTGGTEPSSSTVELNVGEPPVQAGLPPYLTITFIIALQGVFPSRN